MTTIKIHGVLAHDVGDVFLMDVGKTSQVIEAIDANRPGFIKKINQLSRKGFYYSIIVDGKRIKNTYAFLKSKKAKKIDIVPVICGEGGVIIGTAIKFLASKAFITQLAIFIVSTAVALILAPKQKSPDVKATEASTRGLERSFEFSNKQNIAAQGVPVPVGYGRLRVGSQVVQACIKTFPQNVQAAQAMISNPFYTQKGVAQSDNNSV